MTKSRPWPVIGRTIFFTSDKNRATNQKPAITHRDEIYFIDFWRENLSMYRIIIIRSPADLKEHTSMRTFNQTGSVINPIDTKDTPMVKKRMPSVSTNQHSVIFPGMYVMKSVNARPAFCAEKGKRDYGAPFVNLLFISLLVVFFFVICSFIYDNFITDCPFSQRSNFTIIGYLIKPFLYLLVI